MRTAPKPPLSDHRLARLTAWARLWLVWFAAKFVFHFCLGAPRAWRNSGRRQLDLVSAMVAKLLFLHAVRRAAPRLGAPCAIHRYGRVKRRGGVRAMIGSALRRTMQGADLFSRLMSILAVMRDAELHIARLVRRIRRGLTRRRVLLATPAPALDLPAGLCVEHWQPGVDTS